MGINTLSSDVIAERVDPLSICFAPASLTSPIDQSHGLFSFYHGQAHSFDSTESSKPDEPIGTDSSFFSGNISSNTNCDPFFLPLCVGCGEEIKDQYLLRVSPNLEWHIGCLKCADCGQYLDETNTCFVKERKTYCKRDYTRLFGSKCGKCREVFTKTDLVMRAKNRIYHIDCFRCVTCNKQLIPGDTFALQPDGLLCKADHDNATPHNCMGENNNLRHTLEFSSPTRGSSISRSPSSTNGVKASTGRKQRGHRHSSCLQKRRDTKTTRVRTVLNEKQLHTLKTCYAANCRPDALMKEQLTEMTGLSARVIRVWFQNKRCKDKKRSIALKQLQHRQRESNREQGGDSSGSKGLASTYGVAMETADPVGDDSIAANTNEVQNHQKPAWKAFSDFALQSEIEQPAFQQFISHFSDPGHSSASDISEICSIPSVSSSSFDASTTCSTPLFPEIGASACC